MSGTERKPWIRDELILAINLYCKTPFGRIHIRNPQIIELAANLGRTPGSVSYKLANFASIDPSLARKGASNVSKLDREVWREFFANWEDMAFESEMKKRELYGASGSDEDNEEVTMREGETRDATVKVRVGQRFFRECVLSSYDNTCCITGLSNPELLIASHIVPWSRDKVNRLNPMNGLCLNALHDRAFDRGLITVDENYRVVVSKQADHDLLIKYDHQPLSLPKRFIPNQVFLDLHRSEVFRS